MEDYSIVNMKTGECVKDLKDGDRLTSKLQREAYREIVNGFKEITQEDIAKFIEDGDLSFVKYVWHKMKTTGEINKYGFIKMGGCWFPIEWGKLSLDAGKYMAHLQQLTLRVSSRNSIKTDVANRCCKSWKEFLDVLGLKRPNDRSAFKKFLIKHDVVRLGYRPNGERVMLINPNWIRRGAFVSDFALVTFKDVTLKQIHPENCLLLYMNNWIDKEDLDSVFLD